MGSQDRFFGRWLLPVFPIVCLLAAYAALLRRRRRSRGAGRSSPAARRWRRASLLLRAGARLHGAQRPRARPRRHARRWRATGWSRTSRRARRSWSSRSSPDQWAQDAGPPAAGHARAATAGSSAARAARRSTTTARSARRTGRIVKLEDYERTTRPQLIDAYERGGVLLGRHRLDAVRPRVRATRTWCRRRSRYYDELERRGERRLPRSARTATGDGPVDVQLRLVVRLLPARLRAPGPGDDGLPAAGGRCAGAEADDAAEILLQSARCRAATRTPTRRPPRTARSSSPDRRRGGRVSPNPLVGAVVVRDGEVLGEGWHTALRRAARRARGDRRRRRRGPRRRDALRLARAVLPHRPHAAVHRRDRRGRHRAASWSPPTTRPRRPPAAAWGSCATRASRSTSPTASSRRGRGCSTRPFRKHARTGRPWVLFKSAMTLDGKVATAHRRLEVDLRRGQPRAARTAGAPSATPSRSASAPRSPTTRSSPPASRASHRQPRRVVFDSEGAPAAGLPARAAARRGPAHRRRLARRARASPRTRSRPPAST